MILQVANSPGHFGKVGPDELLVVGPEGSEAGDGVSRVEELELVAVLGEALHVVPPLLRTVHLGAVRVVVLLGYAGKSLK